VGRVGGGSAGSGILSAAIVSVAAQSIPNNVDTLASFTTQDHDSGGMWLASAPTVLTIPTDGVYAIYARASFPADVDGIRRIYIFHAGIIVAGSTTTAAGSIGHQLSVAGMIEAAAGDTLTAFITQTSGGAQNVAAILAAHRLGPRD
jgi:hypothetical protein